MRFVKDVYENVMEMLKYIPKFKKVLDRTVNGDVIEKVEEMTFEEKKNNSISPSTPDSFSDSVSAIPDIMYIDKFTAIDKLNAAIAGINFTPNSDNIDKNNDEKE